MRVCSIVRMDVAGRSVTQHLRLLMRKEGQTFNRTSEFETLRMLKEDHCYIAADPDKETERPVCIACRLEQGFSSRKGGHGRREGGGGYSTCWQSSMNSYFLSCYSNRKAQL